MQSLPSFAPRLSFGAICNKTNSHDSQNTNHSISLLLYFGNQKIYTIKKKEILSVKGISIKLYFVIFSTQSFTVQSFNLKIRFQLHTTDSPWKPEDNLKLSHQLRWFRRKKSKEIQKKYSLIITNSVWQSFQWKKFLSIFKKKIPANKSYIYRTIDFV